MVDTVSTPFENSSKQAPKLNPIQNWFKSRANHESKINLMRSLSKQNSLLSQPSTRSDKDHNQVNLNNAKSSTQTVPTLNSDELKIIEDVKGIQNESQKLKIIQESPNSVQLKCGLGIDQSHLLNKNQTQATEQGFFSDTRRKNSQKLNKFNKFFKRQDSSKSPQNSQNKAQLEKSMQTQVKNSDSEQTPSKDSIISSTAPLLSDKPEQQDNKSNTRSKQLSYLKENAFQSNQDENHTYSQSKRSQNKEHNVQPDSAQLNQGNRIALSQLNELVVDQKDYSQPVSARNKLKSQQSNSNENLQQGLDSNSNTDMYEQDQNSMSQVTPISTPREQVKKYPFLKASSRDPNKRISVASCQRHNVQQQENTQENNQLEDNQIQKQSKSSTVNKKKPVVQSRYLNYENQIKQNQNLEKDNHQDKSINQQNNNQEKANGKYLDLKEDPKMRAKTSHGSYSTIRQKQQGTLTPRGDYSKGLHVKSKYDFDQLKSNIKNTQIQDQNKQPQSESKISSTSRIGHYNKNKNGDQNMVTQSLQFPTKNSLQEKIKISEDSSLQPKIGKEDNVNQSVNGKYSVNNNAQQQNKKVISNPLNIAPADSVNSYLPVISNSNNIVKQSQKNGAIGYLGGQIVNRQGVVLNDIQNHTQNGTNILQQDVQGDNSKLNINQFDEMKSIVIKQQQYQQQDQDDREFSYSPTYSRLENLIIKEQQAKDPNLTYIQHDQIQINQNQLDRIEEDEPLSEDDSPAYRGKQLVNNNKGLNQDSALSQGLKKDTRQDRKERNMQKLYQQQGQNIGLNINNDNTQIKQRHKEDMGDKFNNKEQIRKKRVSSGNRIQTEDIATLKQRMQSLEFQFDSITSPHTGPLRKSVLEN